MQTNKQAIKIEDCKVGSIIYLINTARDNEPQIYSVLVLSEAVVHFNHWASSKLSVKVRHLGDDDIDNELYVDVNHFNNEITNGNILAFDNEDDARNNLINWTNWTKS